MAGTSTVPGLGLALTRLTLGIMVARQGWAWVTGEGLGVRTFRRWIEDADASGLLGWWGDRVLLHNPDASAFLLSWTLLLAGIAMTLGAFTRPAATWVGLVALQAWAFEVVEPRTAILVAVVSLACVMSRAGRKLGLDAALDGNLPTWMTWVRGRSDFLD